MTEHESFLEHQQRKERGRRGKSTERLVQAELERWKSKGVLDFDRLPDSRSATRRCPKCKTVVIGNMPETVSDYTVFTPTATYALEVKEIKTGTRLARKSFPQLPRMRARAPFATPLLLVHLVETKSWACVRADALDPDAKSWDVHGFPVLRYTAPRAALDSWLEVE